MHELKSKNGWNNTEKKSHRSPWWIPHVPHSRLFDISKISYYYERNDYVMIEASGWKRQSIFWCWHVPQESMSHHPPLHPCIIDNSIKLRWISRAWVQWEMTFTWKYLARILSKMGQLQVEWALIHDTFKVSFELKKNTQTWQEVCMTNRFGWVRKTAKIHPWLDPLASIFSFSFPFTIFFCLN